MFGVLTICMSAGITIAMTAVLLVISVKKERMVQMRKGAFIARPPAWIILGDRARSIVPQTGPGG